VHEESPAEYCRNSGVSGKSQLDDPFSIQDETVSIRHVALTIRDDSRVSPCDAVVSSPDSAVI
jgi:hypothetical protein